ncbi:MAG: hypothetical protein MJ198_10730 [Bacteroidales bacterium]|nr:hypothetical protein [Bacteroidales bacterium]
MKSKFRNSRLFWFLKNICCLFRCDIYKELAELEYQLIKTQEELKEFKTKEQLFERHEQLFEIMMYYDVHSKESEQYKEELDFIAKNGLSIFPYRKTKTLPYVETGFDNGLTMPWVLHNNKKLYFPSCFSIEQAELTYRNFIENENILGGSYRTKSPHQYQSETFKIEDGDVLVDVGCAEGLVALDAIEKVKKVYLIESDLKWIDALSATFAPYKDKVVIVNKLVAECDSNTSITLATLLKNEKDNSLFIKMDIEGYETSVIAASKDFLCARDKTKLVCCTYHKNNDEAELKSMFESYGYTTEFSDGYMLFVLDGTIKPPFFRHGVIRAYCNEL